MTAFRLSALLLCLACPLWPGIAVHAAQAPAASEAASAKTGGAAAKPAVKQAAKPVARKPAKAPSKSAAKAKRKAAKKSVSKAATQPLPNPKLDLSLPSDMVRNLKPDVRSTPAPRKALLPAMFPDKSAGDDSPFQLNGRLISNEMQLQLRNDSRRDVEGAAIEFEFRN
ncbi:hypothetical protein ACE1YR_01030 [Pseudomonas sp. K1(2024)]|uniref:Translation initiation factor 2 n=1 Tax=Pseudomonas boreofloridensis TaxID=3064348 RepID=A0ABV4Z5V9_9PSED|nr:hypothetical protein [Pseudomonas sp. K13]MDO7900569.1 hypothetical protein [Pseudomonas sp. K13]